MAQSSKKVIVPKSLLQEIDWESGQYLIRYRIVSENKNLRSHWSPVYSIDADVFDPVVGSYTTSVGDDGKNNLNIVWDDESGRPYYDVFVAYAVGEPPANSFLYDGDYFVFHGTTPIHAYSLTVPDGYSSPRIIIQPAANKKLIKADFIIYDSSITES